MDGRTVVPKVEEQNIAEAINRDAGALANDFSRATDKILNLPPTINYPTEHVLALSS